MRRPGISMQGSGTSLVLLADIREAALRLPLQRHQPDGDEGHRSAPGAPEGSSRQTAPGDAAPQQAAPADAGTTTYSVLDRDIVKTPEATEPAAAPSLGGPDLPGEVTALAHLYRGEVQRSNTWRLRLDATTNWALLMTGGLLSFGFNAPERFPLVLALNSIIVLFFLMIEARRYRFYDVWRSRVRLLEVNFVLPFLTDKVCAPRPDWREALGSDLLQPRFKISLLEAFGRRLRRNYVWIFLLLVFAWLADLAIALDQGSSVEQFVEQAAIGSIPGWLVLALQGVYFAVLASIGLLTIGGRKASGLVLEKEEEASLWCRLVDDTHF